MCCYTASYTRVTFKSGRKSSFYNRSGRSGERERSKRAPGIERMEWSGAEWNGMEWSRVSLITFVLPLSLVCEEEEEQEEGEEEEAPFLSYFTPLMCVCLSSLSPPPLLLPLRMDVMSD